MCFCALCELWRNEESSLFTAAFVETWKMENCGRVFLASLELKLDSDFLRPNKTQKNFLQQHMFDIQARTKIESCSILIIEFSAQKAKLHEYI